MKKFSIIKASNGDILYLLRIDGRTIRITEPYNGFSGTYGSICLKVYDDAFSTFKTCLWLLDLTPGDDIIHLLRNVHGFRLADPTTLEKLIYS